MILALFACDEVPAEQAAALALVLEVHAENGLREPEGEVAMVESLSTSAGDFPLSFGLGPEYFRNEGAVEAALLALERGQGVNMHGDLTATDAASREVELARRMLEFDPLAGSRPDIVSGLCDATPTWLEASLAAGVVAGIGPVEYCQLSLDPAGPGAEAYASAADRGCAEAGYTGCHAPAPTVGPDRQRLFPWRPSSTSAWTEDDGGTLVILSGYEADSVDCLARVDPEDCGFATAEHAEADMAMLDASLRQARGRLHPGERGAYYITWSTNRIATTEYIEAWFAGAESLLGDRIEARSLAEALSG